MPAHIRLVLGSLSASFTLAPGEVEHPLLTVVEDEAPAPKPQAAGRGTESISTGPCSSGGRPSPETKTYS